MPEYIYDSYRNQLKKLVRKFFYFNKIYRETMKSNDFQIVLLYDFINIQKTDVIELNIIKEITKCVLNKKKESLKNYGNILFQLIYFGSKMNYYDLLKIKEEQNKKIEEQNKKLEEMDKKIEEMDKIIEEKNKAKAIEEKKAEIEKIKIYIMK